MRFIVKEGGDPVAQADATLLAAMGLPGGGILRLGPTHAPVAPGPVPSPNALLLGPRTRVNAELAVGDTVDARRALLPRAARVTVRLVGGPLEARRLGEALRGRPVTAGDRIPLPPSPPGEGPREGRIMTVVPGGAALVDAGTVFAVVDPAAPEAAAQPPAPSLPTGGGAPTTRAALLAGLETEVEILTGWLSLLTGRGDLPASWGLPAVAGVVIEGPVGCGRAELVETAAAAAGVPIREVPLDVVFRPERFLALLERALTETSPPVVLFLDHLDGIVGEDAAFRTQSAAILRWFLERVAARPRSACVLGVSSPVRLAAPVATSPLLPRRLVVPPPDLRRRRLLFRAALARVPAEDIDYDRLAARSAGFSAADVVAAVLEVGARLAATGGAARQEDLEEALAGITPSLGATSLGEIPSHGFAEVADLVEVKRRLTESVVWPLRDPSRFSRLGIAPPRGLLLHGPPGTGKTFVVRALAHESAAAFFPVKGAELLDKWVGESERAVRELFARARAVAPAILFFDEIDALAPVRGKATNSVTDSVVAALLTEMDGVAGRGDVFVIGATNRKDLVDPALLRAGRLEVHLRLGLPAAAARRAFFALTDVPLAADVDVERLVHATDGMSFADLAGLLREAALQALRRDGSALAVTAADLAAALAVRNGQV